MALLFGMKMAIEKVVKLDIVSEAERGIPLASEWELRCDRGWEQQLVVEFGTLVGQNEGCGKGCAVGEYDGWPDGHRGGQLDGLALGLNDGDFVGFIVG